MDQVRVRRAGVRGVALMLLLLGLPVALGAIASAGGLLLLPYELAQIDARMPFVFRMHMGAGGLALVLMPLAIVMHGTKVHRIVGVSGAVLGVLAGLAALPVALASLASPGARAGFFVQGLVWTGLIAAAVMAVRGGRFQWHARLMLVATGVATAAIWLRLATWVAVQSPAVPFDVVYAVAAWLAWVVPGAIALALPVPHSAAR